MSSSLRHLDVLLVCDICDGEVDLGDSEVVQCRHCGIAFAVDLPDHVEVRRGA